MFLPHAYMLSGVHGGLCLIQDQKHGCECIEGLWRFGTSQLDLVVRRKRLYRFLWSRANVSEQNGWYWFELYCKWRTNGSGNNPWHCSNNKNQWQKRAPTPCWNGRENLYQTAYSTFFAEVLFCQPQTSNLWGNLLSFLAKYLICEILKSFQSVSTASVELHYKHKKSGCLGR